MNNLSDDELKIEYQRLTKIRLDRIESIAKGRKARHEKINFDNPLYINKLKELEQEMMKRGLK